RYPRDTLSRDGQAAAAVDRGLVHAVARYQGSWSDARQSGGEEPFIIEPPAGARRPSVRGRLHRKGPQGRTESGQDRRGVSAPESAWREAQVGTNPHRGGRAGGREGGAGKDPAAGFEVGPEAYPSHGCERQVPRGVGQNP